MRQYWNNSPDNQSYCKENGKVRRQRERLMYNLMKTGRSVAPNNPRDGDDQYWQRP